MKKIIFSTLLSLACVGACLGQYTSKTASKAGEQVSRGNIQGAIKILDESISKGKDLLEAHKMRSGLRLYTGNINGAIEDLDTVIEMEPANGSLYAQRADYKMYVRDETALDDYDQALANGYKHYKVYAGRGSIYMFRRMYDEAMIDYKIALGMKPDHAGAAVAISNIHLMKGEREEGRLFLQNFLSGIEQQNTGGRPKVDAEVVGNSTVLLDKENQQGVSSTIMIDGRRIDGSKSPAGSSEDKSESFEQKMNLAHAYSTLARFQSDEGMLEEAMTNAEKSLAINKNDGFAVGIRGTIYAKTNNLEKALADFDKAIKAQPNFPNYYLDRGLVYLRLGNKPKAEEDFAKFLQINPLGKDYMDRRIKEIEAENAALK